MLRIYKVNSNTSNRNEWTERFKIPEWLERRETKGTDGCGSPSFGEKHYDVAHV